MPQLVPEQVVGAQWLANHTEALLGDIMGYGKSGQAIMAARDLGAERMVVICPAVARLNWEREAIKWGLGLPIVRVTTKQDQRKPAQKGPMLAIASYDGLAGSKALRGALNTGVWDVLVCDEAHRLKSPDANRTKAMYGSQVNGQRCLANKALYRWLLTASPMPNGAGELWSHLASLWPHLIREPTSGKVMSQEQFLQRYCVLQYSEYGYKVVGYKDREGLVAILNHIMLRRTHIESLPPLVVREDPTVVEVDDKRLTELEAHDEFRELESVLNSIDARAQDLDAIEDEFIHLATLRRLTGLLKVNGAVELIAGEMGPGDKTVVFAVHREVIEEMRKRFEAEGLKCAIIHGGVPDGQRNDEIDRFNNDPTCTLFIGQIEACKEAINLQAGNRVRLVEASWCPETNAQAIARVHRRGQLRTVFADFIAIANSIDETVQRVLALKTKNIQALMQEDYSST